MTQILNLATIREGVKKYRKKSGLCPSPRQTPPYMQKMSDVAGTGFLAKKNWRKIWPKNGLKWPKMA